MRPLNFPSPAKSGLQILHLCHCSFAVTDGESVILIDPFLSGSFEWQGHTEYHVDRSRFSVEQIPRCDVVLISHEHRDHYDPDTLRHLLARPGVEIHAPSLVIDEAKKEGLDSSGWHTVKSCESFTVGRLTVTVYPARDSEKTVPVDRVGFHITDGVHSLYHQGDSHGYSPEWKPMTRNLDLFIMWPKQVLDVAWTLFPKAILFQHMDRFMPGRFLCNRDAELELLYHRHYHPEVKFVVPPRNVWLPVSTLVQPSPPKCLPPVTADAFAPVPFKDHAQRTTRL